MAKTSNSWQVIISNDARKQLFKMDNSEQILIQKYIDKLETSDNPKAFAKPLAANLKGLHSYRIGDYRLLCHIDDNKLVIVAVKIAHRREVYEH